MVPFAGCLPSRQSAPRLLHAWDLVLVYYRLKRGVQYNATPQRRLSQSFGLSMVGGTAITSKHVRKRERGEEGRTLGHADC